MLRRTIAMLTCATLAGACSAEIEPDGPLRFNGGNILGIQSDAVPKEFTELAGSIQNEDDAQITILKVSLASENNMKLLGARLFPEPEEDEDGFTVSYPGMGDPFPPPDRDGYSWRNGVEAVGAKLGPNEVRLLGIGLRATAAKAKVRHIRVLYVDEDGQKYERLGDISTVVAPKDEIHKEMDSLPPDSGE